MKYMCVCVLFMCHRKSFLYVEIPSEVFMEEMIDEFQEVRYVEVCKCVVYVCVCVYMCVCVVCMCVFVCTIY